MVPFDEFPSFTLPLEEEFIIRFNNLEEVAAIFHQKKIYCRSKTLSHKSDNILHHYNKFKTYLEKAPGIYLIQNLVTKKKYIGKSSNLLNRLDNYTKINFLLDKKDSSIIYRKIIKFGYNNFSFTILELCDLKEIKSRELHFIDLFKPQYNIRKSTLKPQG
ncbi:hypothetical protein QBC44DRAFT_338125 [Cladorrhinum sp. PSN332]|nr:hypothetical protein QBC44DRAFT_338125 [Cladorrhinum sp. PSN332]